MSHVLAADIGGTNIRLAIIDEHGNILDESREQAALSQHTSVSQVVAETHVINILSKAMQPILQQKTYPIDAVGIGFPGFFRGNSGILAASPNLPLLHDFHLAALLSDSLGKAVVVQNDALCAAIGEHSHGVGQGQQNILHITLGTGIGSGLILNNTPYSGEHGMAMEFGHLCVDRSNEKNRRLCGCGNYGCVEAYASATAVAQRFNEKHGSEHSAKEVFELALQGHQHAINTIHEAGQYLGMAIAEAVKLLDVTTISISGGLSHAWDLLYPSMTDALDNNLIAPLKGNIDVRRSILDDNAGLLGAATIAREH